MYLQPIIGKSCYNDLEKFFHMCGVSSTFVESVLQKYFVAELHHIDGKFCVLMPQMGSTGEYIQLHLFVVFNEQDCEKIAQEQLRLTLAEDALSWMLSILKKEIPEDCPVEVFVDVKTHGATGDVVEHKVLRASSHTTIPI